MAFNLPYEVYRVGNKDNNYQIVKVPNDYVHRGDHSYRRAHQVGQLVDEDRPIFVD